MHSFKMGFCFCFCFHVEGRHCLLSESKKEKDPFKQIKVLTDKTMCNNTVIQIAERLVYTV